MNRKEKRLKELERKKIKTPEDIKKMRKIVEKLGTLRKIIKEPEEEVAEASVLSAKNLYRLLVFLRDIYPIGYSFEGIEKKMNLKIFLRRQLNELVEDHLIKKRDFAEEDKKMFHPNFLKFFPEYAITIKGMEFVNSIEVRNLSKKVNWLTKILIGFGIITIIIIGIQLFFQILQYNLLR